MDSQEKERVEVETWKMKRLIKFLETARGNGTSMISLVLPPKEQLGKMAQKLTEEYGTASNIKSRVNRLSVLSAITSAQQKLKLYTKMPQNGLLIYVGTVLGGDGKEKKISLDFEPFKPINTSLYLCDNIFHVEPLYELLENNDRFGVIVVDGHGVLFGAVCGNTREILRKFTVELPKKHGRGGQSSVRFARLRVEKRQAYIKKVAETANSIYLSNEKVNCRGLILAGSADFKNELNSLPALDPRIKDKILGVFDVSYGGISGFSQALENSAGILSDLKFLQEKKLLDGYFTALSVDSEKIAVGCKETVVALENGAVDTLLVWEELETERIVLKDQEEALFLEKDGELPSNASVINRQSLLEWLSDNYTQHGASLILVSDKTPEGNQFCKGLGGIGARLRYAFIAE